MQYGGAGQAPALADVSFDVGRGEIVALLGPNGAGKTTMMRILTGFLEPTDGDAQLDGHSVRTDGLAARRAVGYLPEGVPLYPDMRVSEYLAHRARLRGVRRSERAALIDRAVDQCGLGERRRQIIGTLSRGYRQRVGLADAILARPPILILDEPTVGLDPNQIREARELVRALGREQTILLSTHILPEVEALAARVLILHRGRMVAAQTPGELRARAGAAARVVVDVRPADRDRARSLFAGVAGVAAVDELSDGRLAIAAAATPDAADAAAGDLREAIFAAAAAGGVTLRELGWERSSLEEVFARITTAEDGAARA
jgi:ABC-2 type transport system ATP-binding protein